MPEALSFDCRCCDARMLPRSARALGEHKMAEQVRKVLPLP
jgi:hypothetical protein